MEMFINIFMQLGTDESIVHQFVIIITMFTLSKYLFINHLQAVLDFREDQTINLAGNADKQFAEVEKIQTAYKEKMQTAHKELKLKTDVIKTEIVKREEAKYREQETEVNAFIEKSRKEIEKEIQDKKEVVLNEAEQLAGGLVQKLAKGIQ